MLKFTEFNFDHLKVFCTFHFIYFFYLEFMKSTPGKSSSLSFWCFIVGILITLSG